MVESGALKKLEPSPWRGVNAIEKFVLALLPTLAMFAIILPFLDQIVIRRLARLPGARPIITWLVNGYSSWIVGAVLMALFALFALWVRHRLTSNKRLWFGTGCPECMERELVRVSRTTSDRYYGLIGVPAYRYACRNCTWRGLRIARREYTAEHLAELEASLLRFDPDSPPVAPALDIEGPEVGGSIETTPPMASSSIFRDVGDAGYLDAALTSSTPEEVEESEEQTHEAEAEAGDDTDTNEEMEWLWRRSSDT